MSRTGDPGDFGFDTNRDDYAIKYRFILSSRLGFWASVRAVLRYPTTNIRFWVARRLGRKSTLLPGTYGVDGSTNVWKITYPIIPLDHRKAKGEPEREVVKLPNDT